MDKDVKNKFKDWFTDKIFYIIIFLGSAVYILRNLITISETGKTVGEIIYDGALFMAFGFIISFLFNLQGILKGYKTKEVTNEKEKHENLVEDISPYANNLDAFCETKTKENLKAVRTRILLREGMAYQEFFNEDGSSKEGIKFDFSEIKKKDKAIKFWFGKKEIVKKVKDRDAINRLKARRKTFKTALNVNLTPLTTETLVSDNAKTKDKFNFGSGIGGFLKKTASKGFIFQVTGAFIFGYYMPDLVKDFSWIALLWTSLQVVWFLSMGLIRYFFSYLYMKNNYASELKKKNQYLTEFKMVNDNKLVEDNLDKITDRVIKRFEVE